MIFSTVPNARSTELAQLCIERLKLCPAVTRSASQHVIASAVSLQMEFINWESKLSQILKYLR